jgi:hypothetical protein
MQKASRCWFVGMLVTLIACMETEPLAASPQRQQLYAACQANDLEACKFLETSDANARAQNAAAWSNYQQQQAARPNPLALYNPYAVQNAGMSQQTTTRCQYIGVQLVCQTN